MNSSFSFLADENIPLLVIKQLREEGFSIISVSEEFRMSSDKRILELSSKNKWIIVTFDKDFGELIYKRECKKPFGIILLRVTPKSPKYILQILGWLLQTSISFSFLDAMTADSRRFAISGGGVSPESASSILLL